MITENIIYFPHHQYNVATELVKNLKVCDVINYGYIKLRDLDKWLKGETISVKMGMLSPTKDGYRELSVVESALKRIKEQDSTSCFEDEDELVPVYIFISEDTDVDWREFLFSKEYKNARKSASREGVKINRKDLSLSYAERYNIDTEESLTEKEEEEKRKKEIISHYEFVHGEGTYETHLNNIMITRDKYRANKFIIDEHTLENEILIFEEIEYYDWGAFMAIIIVAGVIAFIMTFFHTLFDGFDLFWLMFFIAWLLCGMIGFIYWVFNWTTKYAFVKYTITTYGKLIKK